MSHAREMAVRATYNMIKRRYCERPACSTQNPSWHKEFMGPWSGGLPYDILRLDWVDFRTRDNAVDHRTLNYESVHDYDRPTPIYRRGQPFFMNLTFQGRNFDPSRDVLFINFYYGPNPSVPKRTRIVLPVTIQGDFSKAPSQWDARIHSHNGRFLTIQIHIPAHCQVGQWYCVIETAFKDMPKFRWQYRCPEAMFILFNPYCPDDCVFMDNEEMRDEYLMNDNGKIYMGGFRSVKSRPWVFGQFDDCMLPTACLLLEMSRLTHSERGNPFKVARAMSSMIQAARNGSCRDNKHFDYSDGVIEPKYEDENFRGGMSPHAWTGSVQIIEEFLRGGASPVRYGHCWVMAGLMTSLCRALGLPARPVTAYVTAHDTQDSMTIERYVDRFGDMMERGPGRDQPDSIWAFHTWCDVWMMRSDLPYSYSGWQGTDPSRSHRDYRDMFSGSCGPASSEAVRRGDIGCNDDTDAFYACLNSHVRYYYEDDNSEWGYAPFRQYRYPVGRFILTKAIGMYDDYGERDFEEISDMWRDYSRSDYERFNVFNSCRGFRKDIMNCDYYGHSYNWNALPPMECGDVTFECMEPSRTFVGETMFCNMKIYNNSNEMRTVQANLSSRACYYNGVMGTYLKRCSGFFTLAPGDYEVLTLRLDPKEYESRMVDMGFVKLTSTAYVYETMHSFIDEYDFRFEKPYLHIEYLDEPQVGRECRVNFRFRNPMDVTLSDCYLTMEVGCSVRPRTMRCYRDVMPHEEFVHQMVYYPRRAGDRRMVATFSSRQLQDVTGQRRMFIRE